MKLLLTLPLFLTTILGLSAPSRADATAPPPFTPDQAEAGAGPTRPRVSSAVWTSVARAASATPAASPSRPGTAGADTSATGRPTNPALDFDFFNAPSGQAAAEEASSPDERAAQARTRRWMLEVHQIPGIATWAAMVATVTVGQLNYNQLYGGDGGSNKWQTPHQWLVISTSTLFAATGGFALRRPRPTRSRYASNRPRPSHSRGGRDLGHGHRNFPGLDHQPPSPTGQPAQLAHHGALSSGHRLFHPGLSNRGGWRLDLLIVASGSSDSRERRRALPDCAHSRGM